MQAFKAGFGIPSLTTGANSTPLSEDYASRLGFYGGFAAEMQTSKRFGLRAEINYSSQGGKRGWNAGLATSSRDATAMANAARVWCNSWMTICMQILKV